MYEWDSPILMSKSIPFLCSILLYKLLGNQMNSKLLIQGIYNALQYKLVVWSYMACGGSTKVQFVLILGDFFKRMLPKCLSFKTIIQSQM